MICLNRAFVTICLPLALIASVQATTEAQLSAIEGLGHLYGIALPCKYLGETRRIKETLVETLPKQRYLGQAFEEATNESFLKFVETGTACPGESVLAKKVDSGIEALNSVYKD